VIVGLVPKLTIQGPPLDPPVCADPICVFSRRSPVVVDAGGSVMYRPC
jgi:hypothetical protein